MRTHADAQRAIAPLVVCGLALLSGAAGCAATPRSTRITADDLAIVAAEMGAKLRGSHFLAGRAPDSTRLIIAARKAENLSSDLLSDAEKWYLVEKVTSALPIVTLGRDYNLAFVMPEEKARAGADDPVSPASFPPDRRPTHVLGATVRSITRAAGPDRTDLYSVEYRVERLRDGYLEWSDIFEYKRAARGKAYD